MLPLYFVNASGFTRIISRIVPAAMSLSAASASFVNDIHRSAVSSRGGDSLLHRSTGLRVHGTGETDDKNPREQIDFMA